MGVHAGSAASAQRATGICLTWCSQRSSRATVGILRSMESHPVRPHTRLGRPVAGHVRSTAGQQETAVPDTSAQTARDAALSANQFERPTDPAEIAHQVRPLLDEDVLPVVIGEIPHGKTDMDREDKVFSLNRAKALALATGMPNRIVESLSDCLDEVRVQRSRYKEAYDLSRHSDNPVVRDACEMFAWNLADGALSSAGDNLDSAWSDFKREFAERAGPRLLESGAISGPDRHGGYELTIPAETVFAELTPPPR